MTERGGGDRYPLAHPDPSGSGLTQLVRHRHGPTRWHRSCSRATDRRVSASGAADAEGSDSAVPSVDVTSNTRAPPPSPPPSRTRRAARRARGGHPRRSRRLREGAIPGCDGEGRGASVVSGRAAEGEGGVGVETRAISLARGRRGTRHAIATAGSRAVVAPGRRFPLPPQRAAEPIVGRRLTRAVGGEICSSESGREGAEGRARARRRRTHLASRSRARAPPPESRERGDDCDERRPRGAPSPDGTPRIAPPVGRRTRRTARRTATARQPSDGRTGTKILSVPGRPLVLVNFSCDAQMTLLSSSLLVRRHPRFDFASSPTTPSPPPRLPPTPLPPPRPPPPPRAVRASPTFSTAFEMSP